MNFSELKVNQRAKLIHFGEINCALLQRLCALGLRPGAILQIRRRAPLGDPLQISVNQTTFSVRLRDVASLEVEPLP